MAVYTEYFGAKPNTQNILFSLDSDTKKLTVTGTGEMEPGTALVYPLQAHNDIATVCEVSDGITLVTRFALFSQRMSLEKVYLGANARIEGDALNNMHYPAIKDIYLENELASAYSMKNQAKIHCHIGGVAWNETITRYPDILIPLEPGIVVAVKPSKATYCVGDQLDPVGMVVEKWSASADETSVIKETISGYELSGFDSSTAGTKSITVTYQGMTAKFSVKVVEGFSVKFVDWDGTLLKEIIVSAGQAATAPETPTRAGYVFTGWDKEFSTIQESMTITAQYRALVVTGIRVVRYPDKVYYAIGEALDATGLIVAAVMDEGQEQSITDYIFAGFDSTSAGRKQVSITYQVDVGSDVIQNFMTSFAVKVTLDGKNPFEDETNPPKVSVHWPNGEFEDLTHADLEGNSLVLQEGICSNQYFIFGGCLCNMISFTTHSEQFLGTDEASTPYGDIEVYIEAVGTREKIFTGTIDSGKRENDLISRKIIAYDGLYKYRNTDISRWYRNQTVDKPVPMILTQKQFRDLLFDFLGIEQVETELYYDSVYVPDTNATNEMNVVNILKDMCLQNSVFGWMNRDGKFEYLKLPENSRLSGETDGGMPIYEYYEAQLHYDTYEKIEFTEGRIWYPKEFYTYPDPHYDFSAGPPDTAQEAYEGNVFTNRNSFFTGNSDWLDAAWQVDAYGRPTVDEPIFPICFGTTSKIDNQHLYRAQGYRLTVPGNPMNRVGDTIEITTKKMLDDGTELQWVIQSYIMSRTLKIIGEGCMEDTYSANNGPYNGNSEQLGKAIPELSAEAFRTRQEMPVIVYDGSFSDKTRAGTKAPVPKVRCFRQMKHGVYQNLPDEDKMRPGEIFFTYEEG